MNETADRNIWQSGDEVAWCPGCGNFGIREALRLALSELGLKPEQVCFVSGIGQAAKAPHYVRCNLFNGLHGRTLPVATGIKLTNPGLTVIAEGGDGDGYAEGGNHFIHALRRNLDITYLVHNNQIYGLTKGQTSPTSDAGTVTKTTPLGSPSPGFDPVALAVLMDAGLVARGFSGRQRHLADIIKAAITHRGFSLVDILQPCVSFNHVNTHKWYSHRVYELDAGAGHDQSPPGDFGACGDTLPHRVPTATPADRTTAFHRSLEWG
ncbi:2-oxoacid:ferredoxin oxidoreductase subunit beta, partial [candidate division WOR-3 bacterium]|nr:2-oxoacid:ferredoxin oxidoreductase subunit beta [candidate division WOR-3 bacterium]